MRTRRLLQILTAGFAVILFQSAPQLAAQNQAPAALTGQVTSEKEGATEGVGFAQYPGARMLCAQHVRGVNGEEIDWHSFATTDDPTQVVEFYTKEEPRSVEIEGGVTTLRRGDGRILSVHSAFAGDYPKCGEELHAAEKTVFIVSQMK